MNQLTFIERTCQLSLLPEAPAMRWKRTQRRLAFIERACLLGMALLAISLLLLAL